MVSPFLLLLALLPGLVLAGITAYRAARLRLPRRHAHGQVTLILPLTGPAPGLEALLAALAAQTMPPRRLVVAVESAEDPAHARVQALVPGCPFPLQLVLAGRAEHRAAKNSGLIAAAALVDAADDAVVLLKAKVAIRDDRTSLIVQDLVVPDFSNAQPDRPLSVSLPTRQCTMDKVSALKQVLTRHPGTSQVHLRLISGDRITTLELDQSLRVTPSSALMGDLKALLGPGCLGG